ncbi:hypothetical protein H4S08_002627 [Coemansia sp. RSA 1365]|nr:hypothetical protein H4S08_002627 [Coemansia sp. RSA 1365]
MFALARNAVATRLGARNFASRAIYVGSVGNRNSSEIGALFERYGNVVGVRMGVAGADYRYAHVYYGAGEVPIKDGSPQYMADVNPTEEETAEVERAINAAITEFVPGSTPIYVRKAKDRRKEDPKQKGEFERGFAVGYRQGFIDAQKASS